MNSKTYHWHKLAETVEELNWQDNQLCEVVVDGKTICLSLHQGQVHACAHKCPHAGGRMVAGWQDALGNLVCPLHRYRFDPRTGRNSSGEGYYLKTYPVEVRSDGVYVGVEAGGLFGFFR
jgi:3-phenylpropionate/trans-cinnamate dioxygenase ferredoxin subunit